MTDGQKNQEKEKETVISHGHILAPPIRYNILVLSLSLYLSLSIPLSIVQSRPCEHNNSGRAVASSRLFDTSPQNSRQRPPGKDGVYYRPAVLF